MHTELQKTSLIFLLFLLITAPVSAFSSEVVSISITSSHSGMAGFDSKSDFHIKKTPEGYIGKLGNVDLSYNFENLIKEGLFVKRNNSKNSGWIINKKITTEEEVFRRLKNDYKETSTHPISGELIEQFLDSLSAPPKTKLDLSQFNINQNWLRSMATIEADKRLDPTKDYYFLQKSRKSELIQKLSSLEKTHINISRYYSGMTTYDDYPELKAVIEFSDGQEIDLTSNSQHEFMIPWKIRKNGREFINFDIQISKALDKLLPVKFQEKERIKGNLTEVLKEIFWWDEIYGWMNTAEAEFELRGQIDFIKNKFLIINGRLNHDYKEGSWELTNNGKWEIMLSHKNWPSNVFVYTEIPFLSGQLKKNQISPERVHFFVSKLIKIKWLKKYIAAHPYDQFIITINQDRSITSEEFTSTMKKLKQNGNYEWKSFNLNYHEDITSISVVNGEESGTSHWLIFPDNTTTLYYFFGKNVLNWDSQKLSRWKIGGNHYSGARISPDGKIMHP